MIFPPKTKETPEGSGRVAVNIRRLEKLVRRLTPTGPGVSHGPAGTSYAPRPGQRGNRATGAASWL
jgi:hypothetical protein